MGNALARSRARSRVPSRAQSTFQPLLLLVPLLKWVPLSYTRARMMAKMLLPPPCANPHGRRTWREHRRLARALEVSHRKPRHATRHLALAISMSEEQRRCRGVVVVVVGHWVEIIGQRKYGGLSDYDWGILCFILKPGAQR